MIECRGCGIQNIFNNFTGEDFLVCNQCRERLVEPDFCEIYRQFDCQDCSFTMFILCETDFKLGESTCRCGKTNIQQNDPLPFFKTVESAGGLEIGDEPLDANSDWYRSETITDSDYEEMFERDPGDDDS